MLKEKRPDNQQIWQSSVIRNDEYEMTYQLYFYSAAVSSKSNPVWNVQWLKYPIFNKFVIIYLILTTIISIIVIIKVIFLHIDHRCQCRARCMLLTNISLACQVMELAARHLPDVEGWEEFCFQITSHYTILPACLLLPFYCTWLVLFPHFS